MERKLKTNQCGTFSNRTHFYDGESERKLFTLEFDESVENPDRYRIVAQTKSAPELYEALESAIIELESYVPVTNVNVLRKCYAALKKAKGE